MLRKKKKKKKQTSRAKQEICYKVPNTTKKKKGKEKDIKSELRIVVAKKKRSPEHTFCKWLLVSLSAPTSPDYFANLTRGSKRRKKKKREGAATPQLISRNAKRQRRKKKRNAQQFFSPHPMYVHTPNAQQASLFTKASHDQKKKKGSTKMEKQ